MDLPNLISRMNPFPILGLLGGISHFLQILIEHLSRDTGFPTMWHLTNVDSDEPVHPPIKLRNSK